MSLAERVSYADLHRKLDEISRIVNRQQKDFLVGAALLFMLGVLYGFAIAIAWI